MDKLRLQVEPLGYEAGGGFEIQIFVDQAQMHRPLTSRTILRHGRIAGRRSGEVGRTCDDR